MASRHGSRESRPSAYGVIPTTPTNRITEGMSRRPCGRTRATTRSGMIDPGAGVSELIRLLIPHVSDISGGDNLRVPVLTIYHNEASVGVESFSPTEQVATTGQFDPHLRAKSAAHPAHPPSDSALARVTGGGAKLVQPPQKTVQVIGQYLIALWGSPGRGAEGGGWGGGEKVVKTPQKTVQVIGQYLIALWRSPCREQE